MSIHLMSLVWKVKFPSQTQKLLLMRMADFAHEDGSDIYPAIDTVAEDIGASRRQTQYAVKSLQSCDLIQPDGKGARNTNRWKINTDLLVSLALKEVKLVGVHDKLQAVENEGAIIAPRDLLRVQLAAERVQSATQRGATHCTQTLKNHQLEPSGASADARDGSRTSPAGENYTGPMFDLTPTDLSWNEWITFIENQGRHDLADEARDKQTLKVKTKWPSHEKGLQGLIAFRSRKPIDITARIIGESE